MKVILYTTNCPRCRVLEQKMNNKNIKYDKITDVDLMTQKGFMTAPMLEVDEEVMDFVTANTWINEVTL